MNSQQMVAAVSGEIINYGDYATHKWKEKDGWCWNNASRRSLPLVIMREALMKA